MSLLKQIHMRIFLYFLCTMIKGKGTNKQHKARKSSAVKFIQHRQDPLTNQVQTINILPARRVSLAKTPITDISNVGTSPNFYNRLLPPGRRQHQSGILKIKMLNSQCSMSDQQKKETISQGGLLYKKSEMSEIVSHLQQRNLITVDRNKVACTIQSLSRVIQEYLHKIDEVKEENAQLLRKNKKFEDYFKQYKGREDLNSDSALQEQISYKNHRSPQFVIFNLERKIETLNYIIKNYRANNKEEIKQFQKRLGEYKPTIQIQLSRMLAEANKKIEELEQTIKVVQKQCGIQQELTKWDALIRSLKQNDELIASLQAQIMDLKKQLQILSSFRLQANRLKIQNDLFDKTIFGLNAKLIEEKQKNGSLEKKLSNTQQELALLQKQSQEIKLRCQSLEQFQRKFPEVALSDSKKSQTIERMKKQNSALRQKLNRFVKNQNCLLFVEQSSAHEKICSYNDSIEELSSRFCQQIEGVSSISCQASSFIIHLYERTRTYFQKLIDEYSKQLKQRTLENKELHSKISALIASSKSKEEMLRLKILEASVTCNRNRQGQAEIIAKESEDAFEEAEFPQLNIK